MSNPSKALQIVTEKMLKHDAFSQWLGIVVLEAEPGLCVLKAQIKPDMVNGFGICHGGVTFSMADSALAFASNGHGRHAVSIDTAISHFLPAKVGDVLTASAREVHRSHNIGFYEVIVQNQEGKNIAFFKGTVFFKSTEWDV